MSGFFIAILYCSIGVCFVLLHLEGINQQNKLP